MNVIIVATGNTAENLWEGNLSPTPVKGDLILLEESGYALSLVDHVLWHLYKDSERTWLEVRVTALADR